jgi:CheY-like chemotaxis protein/two-component sensor histidine kinase
MIPPDRSDLDTAHAGEPGGERAAQTQAEFLARISHELRNPLNGILGWTQILRRGGATEEDVRHGIEVIDRGARALVQLVDDLLDTSRIGAGEMRLSLAPTDLNRVVDGAIQSVSPAAEAKGVTLDVDLGLRLPPVEGDARRLHQVVWNLLANAVKFTPRGGRVEVRGRIQDDHAVITVRDTGIGIAVDFLPRVFSAFAQQDALSTRRYHGLGLGLAIVRQLTELHGGRVVADSAGVGQGASFEVWLPMAPASPKEAPPSATASLAAVTAGPLVGLRVLVVDDDPTALELLFRLLHGAGAQVHTADSAEAGLASLLTFQPQVLISDIEMPGTDGYTFLRRVRALAEADGGTVPALALTAYVREEHRRRMLLAGFQAHLGKPVDAADLIAAVEQLAGRPVAAVAPSA